MLRYKIVALSAVFVAVLAGSRPVVAQSSGVLASAERAVTEALAEQEEQAGSVIRTPRSTGMAKIGLIAMAAGGVMVLVPQTGGGSYSWTTGNVNYVEEYTYSEKGYLAFVGLATMAAGGVLVWRGLAMVEVPFRVDLTTGRGFRAYRSLSW